MEIVKQEIQIADGSQKMPCHLAKPASGGPYPGVIVIMEAFGLNNNIRNITDRFAGEGFVALAPDIYFRQPNNVVGYDDLPNAMRLMQSVKDDEVTGDVQAAVNYLKSLKEVKPKFGITGFCMGGKIAFLTACRVPDIGASVPFYGGGMVTPGASGKAPIDYVDGLRAPVLAFFGGKDAFIPMDQVEKFKSALQRAGKQAEVIVYEDADHGFMCEERPVYHPAHAKEAWEKTVAFFKKNLA
jgi:carboxymethylenebutenolidase